MKPRLKTLLFLRIVTKRKALQVVGHAVDAMQDLRDVIDACANPELALSEMLIMDKNHYYI